MTTINAPQFIPTSSNAPLFKPTLDTAISGTNALSARYVIDARTGGSYIIRAVQVTMDVGLFGEANTVMWAYELIDPITGAPMTSLPNTPGLIMGDVVNSALTGSAALFNGAPILNPTFLVMGNSVVGDGTNVPIAITWQNGLPIGGHLLPLDMSVPMAGMGGMGSMSGMPGMNATTNTMCTVTTATGVYMVPMTTHVHGAHVAAIYDGNPNLTITPDQVVTYVYDNSQKGAFIWYHDHSMGVTRLNVYAGLVGGYLIDSNTRELVGDGVGSKVVNGLHLLPDITKEVPIVVCDKSFRTDGSLFYPSQLTDPLPGTQDIVADVLPNIYDMDGNMVYSTANPFMLNTEDSIAKLASLKTPYVINYDTKLVTLHAGECYVCDINGNLVKEDGTQQYFLNKSGEYILKTVDSEQAYIGAGKPALHAFDCDTGRLYLSATIPANPYLQDTNGDVRAPHQDLVLDSCYVHDENNHLVPGNAKLQYFQDPLKAGTFILLTAESAIKHGVDAKTALYALDCPNGKLYAGPDASGPHFQINGTDVLIQHWELAPGCYVHDINNNPVIDNGNLQFFRVGSECILSTPESIAIYTEQSTTCYAFDCMTGKIFASGHNTANTFVTDSVTHEEVMVMHHEAQIQECFVLDMNGEYVQGDAGDVFYFFDEACNQYTLVTPESIAMHHIMEDTPLYLLDCANGQLFDSTVNSGHYLQDTNGPVKVMMYDPIFVLDNYGNTVMDHAGAFFIEDALNLGTYVLDSTPHFTLAGTTYTLSEEGAYIQVIDPDNNITYELDTATRYHLDSTNALIDSNGAQVLINGNPVVVDHFLPHFMQLPLPTAVPEYFGNVIMANGQAWPNMTVAAGDVLIDLLNGSDSRFYDLMLDDPGVKVTLVGTDQGLLQHPIVLFDGDGIQEKGEHFIFAPADRYQLLFDFTNATQKIIHLENVGTAYEPFKGLNADGGLDGPVQAIDLALDPVGQVMSFTVDHTATAFHSAISAAVKASDILDALDGESGMGGHVLTDAALVLDNSFQSYKLYDGTAPSDVRAAMALSVDGTVVTTNDPNTIWVNAADTAVTTRKIGIFEVADQFGRIMPQVGIAEAKVDQTGATIQAGGLGYDQPTTEIVKLLDGSKPVTEIWEFYNVTADAHPLHIHQVNFQVLGRYLLTETSAVDPTAGDTNGDGTVLTSEASYNNDFGAEIPLYATDAGAQDTVWVGPGQGIKVVMTFDRPGDYMWHCHILSHEDHDMMRTLKVIGVTGDFEGMVTEDSENAATGLLEIGTMDQAMQGFATDADPVTKADLGFKTYNSQYGTLTMHKDGNWSYSADNSKAAVQAIGLGAFVTDTITITELDGKTTHQINVTINGKNDGPVLDSNGGLTTATIRVNQYAPALMTTVHATDVDANDLGLLKYSIVGGADQAQFAIDQSTGALTLKNPTNFVAPTDVNADLSYEVQVQVADSHGGTAAQMITINAFWSGTTVVLTQAADKYTATGSADFWIKGLDGNDSLTGSSGNDLIQGDAGNDTLIGGSGNDTLIGGMGNDSLVGGLGMDTASYTTATAAVTVNLTTGLATGGAGSDTLSGIENIIGSGFNDTLTGDAGSNALNGGAGNDTLTGGAGIDTFLVNAGVDTITDLGTGGADVLVVAEGATANATVTAAYTASAASINNGAENISTRSFNVNLSAITTGNGFSITNTGNAAVLTGSSSADTLIGGTGIDTLTGGDGNDSLNGGAGNDILSGGNGADTFVVASGVDSIKDLGMGGTDVLIISAGATANATVTANWIASIDSANSGIANLTTSGFGVDLTSVKGTTGFTVTNNGVAAFLIGSGFNDTFIGGIGNDSLSGGAGNDSLNGGAGADSLIGGAGNDNLIGGTGIDRFVVDAGIDTITDLGTGGADVFIVALGATANITVTEDYTATSASSNNGIANITTRGFAVNLSAVTASKGFAVTNTGSTAAFTGSSADDTLIGGTGTDTLTGGAGNDILNGGIGRDTLIGGDGNDTLIGGLGNDALTGGAGSDIFLFNTAAGTDFDTITDFLSGTDKVQLSKSFFGALGTVNSAIASNQWLEAANHTATSATQRVIHDTVDGGLYYDADGSGAAVAVKIAVIGAAHLVNADINLIA